MPTELHEIEKEAMRVVRGAVSLEPPIRVEDILMKTWPKMHVGEADLGDYHGALVTDGGRAAMYVTKIANTDQKNIILAHLTWHWIKQALKGQIDLTRQCLVHVPREETTPQAQVEREADVFAGELLVPLEVLENHIDFPADPKTEGERSYMEQRTIELARQFAVPADVMKARLKLFAARRRSFRPNKGPYRRR